MKDAEPVVLVVDDEPSVLMALRRLLTAAGYGVETFSSAAEVLACGDLERSGCLLLDLQMPGINGLELQRALRAEGAPLRAVFLSGKGAVSTTAQAMKAGALDFLTKPVDERELLAAVALACELSAKARQERRELLELRHRLDLLTCRELEVFALVASGLPNKQIAVALGTVEKTVKVHRAHVMEKMQAASLADLVRFADRLSLSVRKLPCPAAEPGSGVRSRPAVGAPLPGRPALPEPAPGGVRGGR
ncbi:MAG TPA: response regulator [Thermoanaerobaculia bacterium]|nr:response regulator [Thermoanaerobaculia bacterium]